MSRSVRFSVEAASELEAAADWYDEQRPGLGAAFLDAVDAVLETVDDWPGSGAPVPGLAVGLEVRRVPVARFPYHLPYVVLEDQVRVLAVAHDRRRPNYWTSRAAE